MTRDVQLLEMRAERDQAKNRVEELIAARDALKEEYEEYKTT